MQMSWRYYSVDFVFDVFFLFEMNGKTFFWSFESFNFDFVVRDRRILYCHD